MSRACVSLIVMASLLVAGCGGGGALPAAPGAGASGSGSGQCSLVNRQNWAFGQLNEWYLFPETLPAALSPAGFTTVDAYIDALTATARTQERDRFFTFITSIAEEDAFIQGGASAGIGIRLTTDAATRKAFISEAFEGAPGLAAGLDRGDEIVAIGETAATLRQVSDIIAAEGPDGVSIALGDTIAGITRTLIVVSPAGVTRTITVTKAAFALSPVSSRYGAQIISDGAKRVGYLNLRTFIESADEQLRVAFERFRAAGITEFIIDFRYNRGGLVSTANLMGDLLGGNRSSFDVFSNTTYRPEKAGDNSVKRFVRQPQSVSPVSIAFIGTIETASASELVINAFIPYLGAKVGLIGANTFGKPVGQIALDRRECDDRLRPVAFAIRNTAGAGDYFKGLAGLAGTVQATCAAPDDVTRQLGDPQEASVRQALDFLAGKPCTPILVGQSGRAVAATKPNLLRPIAPSVAQREVPGLF